MSENSTSTPGTRARTPKDKTTTGFRIPDELWTRDTTYQEVRDTLEEFGFTAHIRSRGEEARETAQEAGKRARRWGWSEPAVG